MIEELTTNQEYGAFHDIVLGALGVHLPYEKLDPIWRKLPDELKLDAARRGVNDPSVRDNIYLHLQKTKML